MNSPRPQRMYFVPMSTGVASVRCVMVMCALVMVRSLIRASSVHLLDVAGNPTLVDRRFGRCVETQDCEVAPPGRCREPIALLAGRRGRAEAQDRGAIRLPIVLVARTLGGKRLTVGETGRIFRFVQRH